MTQAQALDILKTGANVFLTGEPGSGKTYLVNEYIAYLRRRKIEHAVTASTGIAATHIGGMTIHSWSGIGVRDRLNKYDLDRIASIERVVQRIENARVLVIDEISMLSAEVLSMVDAVCREIRRSPILPFGGLQTILVGDFFQLPPVSKVPNSRRFAYDSPTWIACDPVVCYLSEQYRQDDQEFLKILSAIRGNLFSSLHRTLLEPRRKAATEVPESIPRFYSHNADVDRINEEMLEKIPGKAREFIMSEKGPRKLVAVLKDGCLSPERLLLKAGAAVMFTKNNPKNGFVNGTLGIVKRFNTTTGLPVIKTRNNLTVQAEPMDWKLEEDGRVRALVTQLPLRLAWAITVHKSQGMSLEEAAMDLSGVFEYGQGYVALSRVRRLSGLHIFGWNQRAFQVHPEILARDQIFRQSSQAAETAIASLSPAELTEKHDNFAVRCGGVPETDPEENAGSYSVAEIRVKHPQAYAKWTEEEVRQLTSLYNSEMPIEEIAERLGRKPGGIVSRLKKIGLIVE